MKEYLNDDDMDLMYKYDGCNINDLYECIWHDKCEDKRDYNLGDFEWMLTQSERYKILDDLGLSNSDLECGLEGEILSGYIEDGYIESIAYENDIVWDKTIITKDNTMTLKNGLDISKIQKEGGFDRIATCTCGESRYITGVNFNKDIYNCPNCKKEYRKEFVGNSKGEDLIEKLLKSNNISFSREVIEFESYRFDFVAEYNGVKYYIEIHGKQHYEPVDYFGGRVGFFKTKKSDVIKKKHAEKNGIYIELDYREHDVDILEVRFNEQFLDRYINGGMELC